MTNPTIAWEREFTAFKERFARIFKRRELRESGFAFLDGLLSGAERKTGWMMAEQAGLERPWRMQALLGRGIWSADELRDKVRSHVFETLGDPDGVLVVDETGFVKKGEHSVGVSRQYSGTAGRIENSQIGVFVTYASRFGQALIDRRLYLPKVWSENARRRAQTHVPADVTFATRITIACTLLASALDAGAPRRRVLADSVYGDACELRHMLEECRQSYVLAVRSNHMLRFMTREGLVQTDPSTLAQGLAGQAWAALAAGEGAKGLRVYDWACLPLPGARQEGFERWLVFRRSRREPDRLAYYLAFAPAGTSFAELAGAAGMRWTIEECFERAKDDLGLDHCEARSWHGWHRHVSLVMAAAAFLAGVNANLRRAAWSKPNETSPRVTMAA